MVILKSNRNKFILLLLISAITFAGWMMGMEKVYIRFLLGTTNISLSIFSEGSRIDLEETIDMKDPYHFKIHIVVDGRKGFYLQKIGTLLQSFVIILSWQLFLFFVLNVKTAVKSLVINIGIFLIIQSVFLILLTNRYSSEHAIFISALFLSSFSIIAIVLIIKDNMLYPVFRQ
jgi:hypothetical protein